VNRTIEDIQKDIELLGIKGGYDIEQLLTPQDCRRLSYEIERLKNRVFSLEYDKETLRDMVLEYQEKIDKAIEYIRIYRSYQKIDNKDYLKSRDEIGCLDIYQVDELLDILKEVSE